MKALDRHGNRWITQEYLADGEVVAALTESEMIPVIIHHRLCWDLPASAARRFPVCH